jgi:hypothetical protein
MVIKSSERWKQDTIHQYRGNSDTSDSPRPITPLSRVKGTVKPVRSRLKWSNRPDFEEEALVIFSPPQSCPTAALNGGCVSIRIGEIRYKNTERKKMY